MAYDCVASFWLKVNKTDSCWLWTAGCDGKGYGLFRIDGRGWRAHRVAWTFMRGTIPDGVHVLHRCDNPICVNPDHLFLGTHLDNMRDKETKGRGNQPHGDRHGRAILTERDAVAIRSAHAAGVAAAALARKHGVSRAAVRQLLEGRSWTYV